MNSCACEKYGTPLKTYDDLQRRCAGANEILPYLESLATDLATWMSVYRCRICGTLWAEEYPWGERQGGGPSCLYRIQTADPETWLKKAELLTMQIRVGYEDEKFYESLGPETEREMCRHEGCERHAISLSAMCRRHHFEMVRKKPCPFP